LVFVGLRGVHTEVLTVTAELLDAGIEDDEIVDQLQEAGLGADLEQRPIEGILARTLFLPGEVVPFRRLDRAVAQRVAEQLHHALLRLLLNARPCSFP
jgi:hypothetical protein